MRVLQVLSDRNIGGAGVLLLNLLRHFDRTEVESIVAMPRGSALLARVDALGIPCVELDGSCDIASPPAIRELVGVICRTRAELVHANAALAARFAGRICGIPVVHTRHCCFAPTGIWKLSAWRFCGGICNRALSDGVIATAAAAAENLRQLGIPDSRICVIINGSDPVREVSEEELADAMQKWNIDRGDRCVGICARLTSCKGHDTFLQAAKLCLQRTPQFRWRFLIAGEGEERARLEQLSESLGISASVRFLGFLKDTAPFYRLLCANVNCSTGTETSCLALSEGMSASVPAFASYYGGNPAMLGESDAGVLYPTGDADALADALCRVLTSPGLEQKMREAAYERYLSHYTARRMAEETAAFYRAVKSQAKARRR